MLVNLGSTCNVVDREGWEELKRKGIKCKSWKSNRKLFSYVSDIPSSTLGEFQTKLTYRNNLCSTCFVVIKENTRTILGWQTCEVLGVLKIEINSIKGHNIFDKYKESFSGVGKLKNYQAKLHINKEVTFVAQKPRPNPYTCFCLNQISKFYILVWMPSHWVNR